MVSPHSAWDDAELVGWCNVAKAALLGSDVDVLGGHKGLQPEALQDGGEEEEELHAGQGFSQTDPLP